MNQTITKRQFMYLIIFSHTGLAILIEPALIASEVGRDASVVMIVGLAASLLLILLHFALMRCYPAKGLPDMMESILGKWTGKTLMIVFLLNYPLFISAFVVRSFGDFVKAALLPDTPQILVITLFVINMLIVTRYGLRTTAYLAELVFFPIIILLVVLLVFLIPEIHPVFLLPLVEHGPMPLIKSTVLVIVFPLLESIVFLVLIPHIEEKKGVTKAIYMATIYSGMILIATMFMSIMVLGIELTSVILFPVYLLSKKISIANFFERLEAFMAIIWYVTIFFRATMMFMITCMGLSKVMGFQTHKSIATAMAFCVIALSSVIIQYPTDYAGTGSVWVYYGLCLTVGLPLFLLSVHAIKKFFTHFTHKKVGKN